MAVARSLSGRDETLWVTSPYQDEWVKEDGVLKHPLQIAQGSLVTEACEIDEAKFQIKRIAELKTQPGKVMNHLTNRRNFLKQATHGTGAMAGLPSLAQPLQAEDLGSRIKAVELLVLQQNKEQRRVLKIISSSGVAGYADFPDLDYAPALGGLAKEHLIGANPFAVEAIWSSLRRSKTFSVRIAPRWIMLFGT